MEDTKTIEALSEDYYKASVALSKYRRKHGFIPSARVRGQCHDGSPMTGTIADFGDVWHYADSASVPVVKDDGRIQPWPMSDLAIIDHAPDVQNECFCRTLRVILGSRSK